MNHETFKVRVEAKVAEGLLETLTTRLERPHTRFWWAAGCECGACTRKRHTVATWARMHPRPRTTAQVAEACDFAEDVLRSYMEKYNGRTIS